MISLATKPSSPSARVTVVSASVSSFLLPKLSDMLIWEGRGEERVEGRGGGEERGEGRRRGRGILQIYNIDQSVTRVVMS